MIRYKYNKRIQLLNNELMQMASLVEKQIYDSTQALKNQDDSIAKKVIENDDKVDELNKIIEDKCVRFMATESPVAGDLRHIYTTSKIVTDLERMADHAVDICKIVDRLKGSKLGNEAEPLWEMVEEVGKMIKMSIEAYVSGDVEAAYEICKLDDNVDELYQNLFESILKKMAQNEEMIQKGAQILFASKYIERIGDHVTNICEWIIFSHEGTYVDLNE